MTHAELLAATFAAESEDARTPAQSPEAEERRALDAMSDQLVAEGIVRVESQLDGAMMRRVLTMTPAKWRSLAWHERRTLHDWACARARLIEEKINFMSRAMLVEPGMPEYLRAGAAL